jgi:hypothetical protein
VGYLEFGSFRFLFEQPGRVFEEQRRPLLER